MGFILRHITGTGVQSTFMLIKSILGFFILISWNEVVQ